MKVLVTGGAGFIGSHLANRLLELGHQVVIADNLFSGKQSLVPKDAQFVWCDLTQKDAIDMLPNDIDVIYHLASHVGQELSFKRPSIDFLTNGFSTMLLINWAIKNKIRKFIFASSVNVYGHNQNLPLHEEQAVTPPSPYAVGKVASEQLLKVYESQGLDYTVLRFFNIYGPKQDLNNLKQGMASIFLAYIACGKEVVVTGSKDRFRDFVYVDDVVDACLLSLSPKANGKIYNICSGVKTTVYELIEKLKTYYGVGEDYPVDYQQGNPYDQFGFVGSYEAIKRDLGWQPKVSLDEGLQRMIAWAKGLAPEELPRLGGVYRPRSGGHGVQPHA